MDGLTRTLRRPDIGALFDRWDAAARSRRIAPGTVDRPGVVTGSRTVRLLAHSTVFREGDRVDCVFTLLEGSAKLLRLRPDGRQQIVGFRGPGDLIGYTARDRYPFDAELLTDATVRRHDRLRLEEASRQWVSLSHRLLELCADDLASAQDQLDILSRRSAEGRVAAFVILLQAAARRGGAPGLRLLMSMTRSDIGDYLGLTTESVSRAFSAFRRAGLLREPKRGTLLVLDPGALESMSAIDGGVRSDRNLAPWTVAVGGRIELRA